MSKRYEPFDPNTEVIGQVMVAFIESIQADVIRPHLEQYGLTDIDPNAWYKQKLWLDVLSDLAEDSPGNAMSAFVSVGMKIAETAPLTEGYENLPMAEKYIEWGPTYQQNHRGGDAGEIVGEKVSDTHVKMHVRFPYPDHLEYGAYYGLAKRFLPEGTDFVVKYDEDTPRREEGGEETIIHITWDE